MALLKNSLLRCAAVLFVIASPAPGAEPPVPEMTTVKGALFETQIDPTADGNYLLALFRLWIPAPDTPVKGILAVLPGSEAHGTPLADDPHWQALAAKWGYALLGITFTTRAGADPYYQAEKGSGQALLAALDELAATSGHPELKEAPLAILGHSQGGQFAYHFTCWRPDRVVVFATLKGGYYDATVTDAARAVPALLFTGELDEEFRRTNIRDLFNENTSPATKWCFASEPHAAHEIGRSPDLFVPFIDAVITSALNPVRGNPETLAIGPAASTSQPVGSWLPNHKVAEVWKCFMRGTLPNPTLALDIPKEPSPGIAQVSPGSHDFGEVKDDEEADAATFTIERLPGAPQWDSVRAISLQQRFSATLHRVDGKWQVSARPNLSGGQPLGRLHDTLFLRFSHAGASVLGGTAISLTFSHVHDAISISPRYFYFGTHTGTAQRSIRITSNNGPLSVRSTRLVEGSGAELRIDQTSETSATLTATLTPLTEEASHSGVFVLSLENPVANKVVLPFIAHYKPDTAKTQR